MFVDNNRGIESFERVPRVESMKEDDDINTSSEGSYDDETSHSDIPEKDLIIQDYEALLAGEDASFIQKFTDIDVVDRQRPIDEILGSDATCESSELDNIPSTSFEDENFKITEDIDVS